jgi:hypothetical protein
MPKTFSTQAKFISTKDNYAIYEIDKDIYNQLNTLVVQVKENLKSQSKLNEKFYYPFWKHGTELELGELNDLVYSPKYYIKFYESQLADTDKNKNEMVDLKFNVSFYESKTSMGLRAKLI